jgi:hypothetical protein
MRRMGTRNQKTAPDFNSRIPPWKNRDHRDARLILKRLIFFSKNGYTFPMRFVKDYKISFSKGRTNLQQALQGEKIGNYAGITQDIMLKYRS